MKCPLEALDIVEFQAMQTGLYSLPHHFFFRGCLRLDSQRSSSRQKNQHAQQASTPVIHFVLWNNNRSQS